MTSSFLQTLDPVSLSPGSVRAPGELEAIVEILFHGDLGRVGDRAPIATFVGGAASAPVLIGRESPLFIGEDGTAARSLLDPCLSRRQAVVSWHPERGQFHVVPAPDARRPTRLLTKDGRVIADAFVGPGTRMALGDRVLLLLDLRAEPEIDALGLLGHGQSIAALRSRIRAVASFGETVLVRGETGTGKELVAHAIHAASHRAKQPFIALNCAAVPESLIESELFGYARGAFSGAAQAKAGLFRAAEGGTLFLDEVGEMPAALQAKLLRVLESKLLRPVGGERETPVDVRIVVATHRDLAADVVAGRFREDLYGRLASPEIIVPPLRDRPEDIPLLFTAFLKRRAVEIAGREGVAFTSTRLGRCWQEATTYRSVLPLDFFQGLLTHGWPRNVRELDKLAAEVAASVLHGQPLPTMIPTPLSRAGATPVPPSPLPLSATPPRPSSPDSSEPDAKTRTRPERADLERALAENDFSATDTARALGLPYATLDRWMRELGLARPKDLGRDVIEAAWRLAKGDVREVARTLRVSARGLKTRLKELGIGPLE